VYTTTKVVSSNPVVFFISSSFLYINRIGGVMVSLLALSAVDHGFESGSDQTKDYKIGICCFSAKHAADDDEVRFDLDQHAEFDFFHSASSLKQQSAGRHVDPLRHIILIPSQPVFAVLFVT
jgi:hypothetical protein